MRGRQMRGQTGVTPIPMATNAGTDGSDPNSNGRLGDKGKAVLLGIGGGFFRAAGLAWGEWPQGGLF